MNIIVSAAALRSSGGLSIYKQFLYHLQKNINGDRYFIFIDKCMPAPNINGIEYIVVDLKSHFRRIKFDNSECLAILKGKGINADVAVSLQNTCVKAAAKKNILYYHQSLPFYSNHWNPLKKDERLLFYYKWIYPIFVKRSLVENVQVVVQIPFIKRGFCKRFHIPEHSVHILFPDVEKIDIEKIELYNWKDDIVHFIYPATAFSYKRHKILISAVSNISKNNPEYLEKFKIHFTISENEVPQLKEYIKNKGISSNIDFMGRVSHEVLLSMYKSCSALLFPSVVETLGLPLLEAAAFGLPIVVSDLDYSREVLGEYAGGRFVASDNLESWSEEILKIIDSPTKYKPIRCNEESSWKEFFKLINGTYN